MDLGDLISSLPDALVCHILSFLSTKYAASTSVLAKRWRYLLAFVPNLDLDNSIYDHPEMRTSFKVFVDRVMALQGNAPLNKFSLKCKVCSSDPSCVNSWILKALERFLVDLDVYIVAECKYPLPQKVFMCKTLVRLRVAGRDWFAIDVGEVFLPKLKTLYLDEVVFADETGAAFAKLVSGCHALEELILINMKWVSWESCSVSNPTLKRLSIYCESIGENPKSVSFDTPNLVYLEFSDTVAIKYPKVNLDSLVEASLGLRMTPDQVFSARDSRNGY